MAKKPEEKPNPEQPSPGPNPAAQAPTPVDPAATLPRPQKEPSPREAARERNFLERLMHLEDRQQSNQSTPTCQLCG